MLLLFNRRKTLTPLAIILAVDIKSQKILFEDFKNAIAFATSLAFGEDPANVTYDSNILWMHLMKCLDEKQITCFPKSTEKSLKMSVQVLVAIELYFKCCMSYN